MYGYEIEGRNHKGYTTKIKIIKFILLKYFNEINKIKVKINKNTSFSD